MCCDKKETIICLLVVGFILAIPAAICTGIGADYNSIGQFLSANQRTVQKVVLTTIVPQFDLTNCGRNTTQTNLIMCDGLQDSNNVGICDQGNQNICNYNKTDNLKLTFTFGYSVNNVQYSLNQQNVITCYKYDGTCLDTFKNYQIVIYVSNNDPTKIESLPGYTNDGLPDQYISDRNNFIAGIGLWIMAILTFGAGVIGCCCI